MSSFLLTLCRWYERNWCLNDTSVRISLDFKTWNRNEFGWDCWVFSAHVYYNTSYPCLRELLISENSIIECIFLFFPFAKNIKVLWWIGFSLTLDLHPAKLLRNQHVVLWSSITPCSARFFLLWFNLVVINCLLVSLNIPRFNLLTF